MGWATNCDFVFSILNYSLNNIIGKCSLKLEYKYRDRKGGMNSHFHVNLVNIFFIVVL